MQQTLEDADAQTHQGNDHKDQQQRSLNDGRADLGRPGHSAGENIADIGDDGADGGSGFREKTSLQEIIILIALQMKQKQMRPNR